MEIRAVRFRIGHEWRVGVLYCPSGTYKTPAVLMLHGFPGAYQNEDIAAELCRRGMTVFLPHFRGSWGSSGRFGVPGLLRDAEGSLRLLERYHHVDQERIGLLGYSIGGWIALRMAGRRGLAAVAVMAPAVPLGEHPGDPAYLRKNLRVLNGPAAAELWAEYLAAARADHPEVYVPAISPTPLLFVQGRHDQLAPPQATERLWSLARQPKDYLNLEDEDHLFQINRPAVIAALCGWLESRLAAWVPAGV